MHDHDLGRRYADIRSTLPALAEGLSDADLTAQSAEFASPGKWHLAHTSWFFEQFLLGQGLPGYRPFDARFAYLFNSYYEAVGERHARARRGLLTRPPLDEVLAYRAHVDAAMRDLLGRPLAPDVAARIELGLQHEQQHQELFLTDLLHLFAQNPLQPAVRPSLPWLEEGANAAADDGWAGFGGGRVEIGDAGPGFHFDHEGPRHAVWLRPFRLAPRPVTQRDWLAFIADGGYRTSALWLSDGWEQVLAQKWSQPQYWSCDGDPQAAAGDPGRWRVMTLGGPRPLCLEAPVAHVSFFEADAYARWAGRRLPTEFEWEHAARETSRPTSPDSPDAALEGNFVESGLWQPAPPSPPPGPGLPRQLFGDVWEWTASPFVAYPGFRPAPGAVGEYNGKFMNGQYVLRGGSCVSPASHLRAGYRNFFAPGQRWQFSGLRLAEDA